LIVTDSPDFDAVKIIDRANAQLDVTTTTATSLCGLRLETLKLRPNYLHLNLLTLYSPTSPSYLKV